MSGATIVLDIGKTNAKLALIDGNGNIIDTCRRVNTVLHDGQYPHLNTEGLWQWMLKTFTEFARRMPIAAIVPVAHGATAALVDDDELALPVLDYESALPEQSEPAYRNLRDRFDKTYSPALPLGLNLGRQLFWLSQTFPAKFAQTRHILMYPQYWAWRLSGVAASEVTSLGCHTDLWRPHERCYSTLVERMQWRQLFPPLREAGAALGTVRPSIAARTGLPLDCMIICGIHDSNASLLRHLPEHKDAVAPTVLSTGTWVVAAAFDAPLDRLVEEHDMLANVNAFGDPVACMRFMGGREFSAIAGEDAQPCEADDIASMIERGTMALPCFAEAGGPFANHANHANHAGNAGHIHGPQPRTRQERYAVATLYCALMTDFCLDRLGTAAPVVVEGSFAGNPFFAPLLAALRPGQTVSVSNDASGTTSGGLMLHRGRVATHDDVAISPFVHAGAVSLGDYRARWRMFVES
jgi:L-fuculokinase